MLAKSKKRKNPRTRTSQATSWGKRAETQREKTSPTYKEIKLALRAK
jgi:hypothetical protein